MAGKPGMLRTRANTGTAREALWKSMRILRRFTVPDLVRTLPDALVPTSRQAALENARKFVRRLEHHGYLRKVGPRATGLPGVFQAYALVEDVGPTPPPHCARCGRPLSAVACKPNEGG